MTKNETDGTDGRLGNAFDGVTRGDVLRVVRTLLLVVVVVPFVVYAVPQLVGASHSFVVLSGSMEPAISTGDVIVVEDVPASDIEEGDVITFGGSATEPATTHRVIAVGESDGERVFRTKGDANEDPDASPVAADEVVGRVMELPVPTAGQTLFAIPYIGYVIEFAGTPRGFVALVVLPFGLLGVSELWEYASRSSDGGGEDASATVAEPTGETEPTVEDGTDDPASFTVDSRYLTLLTAALVGGGGVAGQRAYASQDPVLATVAVAAVTAGVVLAGFVFYGDDEAADGTDERAVTEAERDDGGAVPDAEASAVVETDATGAGVAAATDADAHLVSASVPADLREWPRLEVDSAETLARMAAVGDSWVVEDEATGERFVFADGVAYAAPEPADDTEEADAETETDGAAPADAADDGLFETPAPGAENGAEAVDDATQSEATEEVEGR
jgi:signal peptidase